MTINRIKIMEKGFITLTNVFDIFENFFCIKNPISSGIAGPITKVAI